MLGPVSGGLTKGGNVTANEGDFFGSAPAFQLALCGNRVRNILELLRENQPDGSSGFCVAAMGTIVVFGHTPLKAPSRGAHVETAIRTFENVDIRAHPARPHTSTGSA